MLRNPHHITVRDSSGDERLVVNDEVTQTRLNNGSYEFVSEEVEGDVGRAAPYAAEVLLAHNADPHALAVATGTEWATEEDVRTLGDPAIQSDDRGEPAENTDRQTEAKHDLDAGAGTGTGRTSDDDDDDGHSLTKDEIRDRLEAKGISAPQRLRKDELVALAEEHGVDLDDDA